MTFFEDMHQRMKMVIDDCRTNGVSFVGCSESDIGEEGGGNHGKHIYSYI